MAWCWREIPNPFVRLRGIFDNGRGMGLVGFLAIGVRDFVDRERCGVRFLHWDVLLLSGDFGFDLLRSVLRDLLGGIEGNRYRWYVEGAKLLSQVLEVEVQGLGREVKVCRLLSVRSRSLSDRLPEVNFLQRHLLTVLFVGAGGCTLKPVDGGGEGVDDVCGLGFL